MRPTVAGSGDQWRSWSPADRRQFLIGYFAGRLAATYDACKMADEFALANGQELKIDRFPSRRCIESSRKYTKTSRTESGLRTGNLDVSQYSDVLDIFYAHAECRMMPYEILLSHLDDAEFKTGEDLFRFVRWGPEWGTFSGFDGMEHCLPGYGKPK